ncbi:MAG TPA: N-acetylmuramoyl-L-alanine amidase [Candidatus Dormibacteraeota bacterium]|nr:N-acetylmuramoyl-L-alanine amidase [Candidatus Dormibacteraeota bacterium]
MTNEEGMPTPNDKISARSLRAASDFVIRDLSVVCHSVICRSLFVLLLFTPALQAADNLGVLGSKPKWDVLEHYQETITQDEFSQLIQNVYCTHGLAPDLIEVNTDTARILTNRESQKFFTLRFAKNDTPRNPVPRLWHAAKSLPPAKGDKPLSGLRIALDPGHLGGKWAKMEERWFQVGNTQPVQEGDLTLKVAGLLAPRLRELGAKVLFVRNSNEPVTAKRPDDFRELARKILIKNGVPQPRADVLDPNDPEKEQTIRWQSAILFYRYSEIRRRAALVNFKLHPDLVICLHFNAEGWGDPNNPTLTDINHLHLLVNGSYLQQELEFDDERFEMIRRLLSRAYDEELPLADTIAAAMVREMQLPPYQYPTTNSTTKVGTSGYVFARNLLATRLYRCPVVYCEPYVMNSKDAFARIQAGDYEGTRNINGPERKSIFREYADGVTDGLIEYYSKARGKRD